MRTFYCLFLRLIVATSCPECSNLKFGKNRITNLVFTEKKALRLNIQLDYHDYCSLEVKAYGNQVSRDGYDLRIDFLATLTCQSLQDCIKQGTAKFVYHLECAQTGFRTGNHILIGVKPTMEPIILLLQIRHTKPTTSGSRTPLS